jgi:hypothetical protein
MSNTTVQIGKSEEIAPNKKVIKASLGGTFTAEDTTLLSEWAKGLNSSIKELSKDNGHSICILIDISSLETYTSPEIVTLLADLMKKDNPYVYKTATFGGNYTHEMTQGVISGLSNRDNIKNFKNEAEALEWLKS